MVRPTFKPSCTCVTQTAPCGVWAAPLIQHHDGPQPRGGVALPTEVAPPSEG